MPLPCSHQERITRQVRPTIDLLRNLDEWHPDVLLQHDIQPKDYNGSLVFRSAVESIRGKFIASSTSSREGLIESVLDSLAQRHRIVGYKKSSGTHRHDFEVAIARDPDYFAALEVKGGEGNSVNISERPLWAREFGIWCHLDGAIVNEPAHGAHAILNRLTNELVLRQKQVDVLFFKDPLCGTALRPCPKYPNRADNVGEAVAPDVFLFPQRIPRTAEPTPPVHTLETLRLPRLVLNLFGVKEEKMERHIWQVHVRFLRLRNGRTAREVKVFHEGQLVATGGSRGSNRRRSES